MRFVLLLCFAIGLGIVAADESTTLEPSSVSTAEPNSTTVTTPSTSTSTSTLTPPPITTQEPPVPPTEPTPAKEKFFVNETGTICIVADFGAQFQITYNNTAGKIVTAYLNVVNATVDDKQSKCASDNSTHSILVVYFGGNNLTLEFTKDSGNVYASEIILSYVPTEKDFPGHPKLNQPLEVKFSNQTLFQVPEKKSYQCTSVQINQDGVVGKFTDVQIEAFRSSKDTSYSEAQDCAQAKLSDLVPIAVGCALLALVFIVLVAYFIGRRRSRRLAYQSV